MLRETAAALLAALLLSACAGGGAGPADRPLSVVFISIDTLRADHVGCYGHPAGATPNIDRLAAEGTRFEACTSSCPLTLPSHSTMMTGNYPFVHGARVNLTYRLAEENVTLAEVLRDAGYATHAEVAAAVLEREFGLAQGFDSYNDSFVDEQVAAHDVEDELFLHDPQRPAAAVTDAALAWIDAHGASDRPFFLFVHYFDPHRPHKPPPAYRKRFESTYLAEIAYADAELGRLLERLREPAFADRTLVVLTSDHGDGLLQHRESTHGAFLYETTLGVPLILKWPGGPQGRTVATPVGLVDLFPTILELLDVAGRAEVQGESLVPLVDGPRAEGARSTYAESLDAHESLRYSPLRALRQGPWKYIHGPRPELYQLEQDPAEEDNRAARRPEKLADMRAALRALIADAPPLAGRGAAPDVDSEQVRRLVALGYAEAGQADDDAGADDDPHSWTDELAHFEPSGACPMERARDLYLLSRGLGALGSGHHEDGIAFWGELVERNPDYAPGHSYLGQCYASLGRAAEAIAPLTRAVELDGTRCEDHLVLGSMLAETGELERARSEFEFALACAPDYVLAAFNLGKLALRTGDAQGALEALEVALELDPRSPKAHSLRGRALWALGREDAAEEAFREALRRDPRDGTSRIELAGLLHETGRLDDAEAVHDESLRILPRNVSIRAAAARFWIDRGEAARALELLEDGLRQRPDAVLLAALRVRVLATASDPSVRDGARALRLAEALLKGGHGEDPRVLAAAAAAAAEGGDFERAIELGKEALGHARERQADALVERITGDVTGYRESRPARMD